MSFRRWTPCIEATRGIVLSSERDSWSLSDQSRAEFRSRFGFLAMGSAISFFIFWPFAATGQPSNMIRLLSFKDARTLRYSVVTVAIYYSMIYFSLVVIFCCARVLMPGMEIDPDRTMPDFAARLTSDVGMPWLAGLLVAAPFAAVMSSVDSFLLVVSSAVVRDMYQGFIDRARLRATNQVIELQRDGHRRRAGSAVRAQSAEVPAGLDCFRLRRIGRLFLDPHGVGAVLETE